MKQNNFEILILADDDTIKNKLFKNIIKNNSFKKIDHAIIESNKTKDLPTAKLVIVVGETALNKLEPDGDINKLAGKFIKKETYTLFCTYSMNDVTSEMDFIYSIVNEHFKKISELYFKSKSKTANVIKLDSSKVSKLCYSHKLPDWCYDENHILIDIQFNMYQNKLIFGFRDKEGNKKYHYENSRKRYFYTNPVLIKDSDIIMNVEDVELQFNTSGLLEGVATYEGDVSPEIKHSIDYYYNRTQPEILYQLKKLYWDIEVYTGEHKAFPFPLEAEHPINSISFKLNLDGKTHVYILNCKGIDLNSYHGREDLIDADDSKSIEKYLKGNTDIEHYDIKVFDTEKDLIEAFLKKVHQLDPDVLAGWNTDYFDVPYLVNRMYKLNIDVDLLSPIKSADVNISEYFGTTAYGLYFADQLTLYKKLTQNVEESYKLSTISQKILGSDKIAYEGTINDMYEQDLVKFVLYSGTDTELLAELEEALNHIQLNFELIKTCCSTWRRVETTSGMVDPLLLKFAKDRNKVCRNRVYNSKEVFSGAYVIDPKIGLHEWVCDFDFASLYPSIIRSLNLGPNTYKAKISDVNAELYLYNFDKLPPQIEVTVNPILSSFYVEYMTPDELKEFIELNDYILSINGCMLLQHDKELSFFYEVLTFLGDHRNNYKKMLGDLRQKYNSDLTLTEEEKISTKILMNQYDNKQSTVKIIANSIYGIISMPYFRMYNIDIAKAVTGTGQEALKFSALHLSNYMKNDELDININFIKEFENSDLPYIGYGDTDSLFCLMGDYLVDNKLIEHS